MLREVSKKYDCGIVVARFQIDTLHDGQIELMDSVIERHQRVILFLGCNHTLSCIENPLDFISRKNMIEELYGNKISMILPIYDDEDDVVWSKKLDDNIRQIFPLNSVVLYGSRDSFIKNYHGKFDVIEFETDIKISASEIRERIRTLVGRSREFRSGMIYATYNQYPTVFSSVDVAIMNEDYTKILLCRKLNSDKYRFVGGIVDITDKSLVDTVKRETLEETKLEIDCVKYICSHLTDDWRYRSESNRKIMTHFHIAKKIFGSEQASDDIIEVKWFDLYKINSNQIIDGHHFLLNNLKTYLS